jgi:hypothetical protein
MDGGMRTVQQLDGVIVIEDGYELVLKLANQQKNSHVLDPG